MGALAPNAETRKLFGSEPSAAPTKQGPPALLRAYNDLVIAAEVLFDVAAAGHDGAARDLTALTDRATKRAGDWERMKYVKKG